MVMPRDAYGTVATCVAVLRANGPMMAGDLAELVGMKRDSSSHLGRNLRAHPDIVSQRRSFRRPSCGFGKAEYFAFREFPPEAPNVPDLWAGWRNPVTGITPPRLGLDSMPTTGVDL
jgi:hypothetical protein